jgi:hypothetical protein
VRHHQPEGTGGPERPGKVHFQRSKLPLKPGALVSLAREAIESGVLDGELANLVTRNQVHSFLAAFGAVRSIKYLD